jgi:CHAT domain-containing protein
MRRPLLMAVFVLGFPVAAWMAWEGSRLEVPSNAAKRLVEPRLTGSGSYAPCETRSNPRRVLSRTHCAGFPELEVADRRDAQEAAEEGEEASRGRSAASIEKDALAFLQSPRSLGSVEWAVRGLERIARENPENAEGWSNLAAARFVLAQSLDDPSELIRALPAAERATHLSPSLLEARFNRALILDLIPLRDQAIAAWSEYLELDSTSGWAREAREHLAALKAPSIPDLWSSRQAALREAVLQGNEAAVRGIVAISPQKAREHAQEDLLGGWGEQVLSGKDATRNLAIARAIGAALADPSVLRAVRKIDEARLQPDVLEKLARGHRAYRDASQNLRKLLVERSATAWTEAQDSLARSGSPMALWAELGQSGVDFYQGRLDEAFQKLQSIASRAESEGQLSLAGRARGALGLIRARQGRFSESLRQYRAAARWFEQTGEQENQGMLHELLAENLRFLGQDAAGWRHRYRAISLLARYPESMRLHTALWEGGLAALEDGEPEAALLFQAEGLHVAERTKDPGMIAEALLHRGEIHQALGNAGAALRDLDEARRLNGQFEDLDIREKLDADIALAQGKLQISTDPRQALVLTSEALEYYERKKLSLELVDAYLGRARASLALRQDETGGEDLAAALGVFETQRASVSEDASRLSYSETVQELFDEMISLRVRQGRVEEALALSDRARTVPLVRRAGEGSSTLTPDALQRIPAALVFVEYALMKDRLLIWVVRRGHLGFTSRPLQPGELAARVERFLGALRRDDPVAKIDELAEDLHDLLIPDEARALPASVELRFVPDKILNAVPFAALRDRRQGRYLIEKHPIAIAPSISFVLDARDRRNLGTEGPRSALLVGATEFDRSLRLSQLPGAGKEIEEIRPLYRDAVVLLGEEATRQRILDALGQEEVLQFSGHGVFNARNPDHSYLAVAPSRDAEDAGLLFAHELTGRNLERLRLVVLSACDSLGPRNSRTAGLSGIARPFLDAGVPAVLGTLWEANDRASAALMPEFHREFVGSGDVSVALREAQLGALLGGDTKSASPSLWGVFTVIDAGL